MNKKKKNTEVIRSVALCEMSVLLINKLMVDTEMRKNRCY